MKDVMAEFYDGPHATPPPASDGPVYLGIKNMTEDGHLDLTDIRHIAEQDYPTWTRRVEPRCGDVIFTYEASLHRYAIIPEGFRGTLGRRVALLRPRKDVVDTRFLLYVFVSPQWRNTVQRRLNVGSTVDRLPLTDFPQFPIRIPPLPTQRKIAAILSAYDDLIENNNRRIKLLEEMAQRIYREWFVDFRYPGHENVPLVDSELGPIPEGWTVQGLFDVADITFGFPFKSDLFNSDQGLPIIRIRDIPAGESATRTTESPAAAYRVLDGDLLVGMDGDFHMGRWSAGEAWLNQRVARLRVASAAICRYGLYLSLEKPIRDWNRAIVGTTVAHLGKRHLELIKVLTPPPSLASPLAVSLDPIFDLEIGLRKATRHLRITRDLLLPRLVSGKIDVTDLDIEMPAAAA
jgi:type I restriction enzyme S subunit